MLEVDVNHGSNNEDSDPDSEDSDHYSEDNDLQEEDQEEPVHNVVESDNGKDNDNFEIEDEVYQAGLANQRQSQRVRRRRRNNLRQDEDSDNDTSTSTTSTVPVRGIVYRLDSNLNSEGYWKINNSSDGNKDSDGILFAMLMAEQAGVKMIQEYFELGASKSTPMYRYQKGLAIFGDDEYQATVKELRVNLISRGCVDVFTEKKDQLGHIKRSIKLFDVS